MPLETDRDPDFEARWNAWVARGAAHDRAIRRRLAYVLPGAFIVGAAVLAWFIR